MSEQLTIWINGKPTQISQRTSVAAAIMMAGLACRASVTGEPRTALCGMGICFECSAKINGVSHQRTCQILCREGMQVATHD